LAPSKDRLAISRFRDEAESVFTRRRRMAGDSSAPLEPVDGRLSATNLRGLAALSLGYGPAPTWSRESGRLPLAGRGGLRTVFCGLPVVVTLLSEQARGLPRGCGFLRLCSGGGGDSAMFTDDMGMKELANVGGQSLS
jgi:hypothetical protein